MHFRFPGVASDGREQENKTLPLHLWDQTQKEVESDILWINIYKNCKRNQYYFLAIISVVPLACQFYFTSNYSSKGQAFFRAKWAPWAVELLNGKFGVLAFKSSLLLTAAKYQFKAKVSHLATGEPTAWELVVVWPSPRSWTSRWRRSTSPGWTTGLKIKAELCDLIKQCAP